MPEIFSTYSCADYKFKKKMKTEEKISLKQFDSICKSISRITNVIDYKKDYNELVKEINRLQGKYDILGHEESPIVKLRRIEQQIDTAIGSYIKDLT